MRMAFSIHLSDDIFAKGLVNDILAEVLESAFKRVSPHLHRHPRDFQWEIYRGADKSYPYDQFTAITCRFEVDEEFRGLQNNGIWFDEATQNFVGIVRPSVLQQLQDIAPQLESIIPVDYRGNTVRPL